MTWEHFFEWLMDRESRTVTNDPRDPGGQTCWGISRRYHPGWPGWQLVDAGTTSGPDLERAESAFYRVEYTELWALLPARVREVAVDTAANMGHVYAVQCLQDALNRLAGSKYVDVDGQFGPQTKEAARHCDPSALAFAMCAVRLAEYGRRGRKGDPRRVFLDGWINRVRSLMGEI